MNNDSIVVCSFKFRLVWSQLLSDVHCHAVAVNRVGEIHSLGVSHGNKLPVQTVCFKYVEVSSIVGVLGRVNAGCEVVGRLYVQPLERLRRGKLLLVRDGLHRAVERYFNGFFGC